MEAANEGIGSSNMGNLRRITKRLHVGLNLLKLLVQRIDLLHLIGNLLNLLRDVLNVLDLREGVGDGIRDHDLRAENRRRDDERGQ